MKPIFLNPDRDLENTTESVQRETTFCKVCMEVKNNYKSSCEISNVKSQKIFWPIMFPGRFSSRTNSCIPAGNLFVLNAVKQKQLR